MLAARYTGLPLVSGRHMLIQGHLLTLDSVEVLPVRPIFHGIAVPKESPSFELWQQQGDDVLERLREEGVCLYCVKPMLAKDQVTAQTPLTIVKGTRDLQS